MVESFFSPRVYAIVEIVAIGCKVGSGIGRPKIYAIVEISGKQYRVTPGQLIDVDRMAVAEGDAVEFDKVLLIGGDDGATVGKPAVDGAKVIATAQGAGKAKKIIVFRYKAKVRHSNKTGHRQLYTRLAIDKIVEAAAVPDKPASRVRRSPKAAD